jgi:hypothetical protein
MQMRFRHGIKCGANANWKQFFFLSLSCKVCHNFQYSFPTHLRNVISEIISKTASFVKGTRIAWWKAYRRLIIVSLQITLWARIGTSAPRTKMRIRNHWSIRKNFGARLATVSTGTNPGTRSWTILTNRSRNGIIKENRYTL